MNIADLLNPYDRRARLYPALLAIFPMLVLLPALYGLDLATIAPLAAVCGVGFLLTQVARNAGARIQDALWKSWGASPSVQLLRHRDRGIDALTKLRYHKTISGQLGFALPTASDEQADPGAADEKYRAAVQLLINTTRSRVRYPLVLAENAAYGFHRNGMGLRRLGIAIAVTCIGWTLLHAGLVKARHTFPWVDLDATVLGPAEAITLVASVFALLVWLTVFTSAHTKQAAFAYARRLIECSDDLAGGGNKP